jgi:sigma-B regulation protein RsbU (phosphoserine phosphatase)
MPTQPQTTTPSQPGNWQSPGGTPPPRSRKNQRLRGLDNLDRFWQRVTAGLELTELWSQFKRDAQSGYKFYQRDFDLEEVSGQPRGRAFVQRLKAFMWAVLEKLTPARRVLLLIGVVLLVLPSGGVQFHRGTHDVQIVTPNFQFWGGVALFLVLMLEIADRVVMKRDLEIARDIQSWLLPSTPPLVPGLAIAFATRPANTVAGDYYDVFPRVTTIPEEPTLLLAVADVAGKSIPAALLMATFQASLKTLSSTGCKLQQLVAAMNNYACCNSQGGLRFTTAFIGEYQPGPGVLTYINAGHNNPVLRRGSGAIERLDAGGLPLGIQPNVDYASAEVTLVSGDWLIIFTDGLVEAVNGAGEEYGEQRMIAVLNANTGFAPDLLLDRMMLDVNAFVGSTPQHDDITCMLIKVA